jgi:hypothetical protein
MKDATCRFIGHMILVIILSITAGYVANQMEPCNTQEIGYKNSE